MADSEAQNLTQQYVMHTYNRLPLEIARGKGARVWDAAGKEYLDFFSGLAVTNLGHGHPRILKALQKQAKELWHVSNVFFTEPQAKLAEYLITHSFPGRVFFCNSGAEANEGAVKLARKYSKKKYGAHKSGVITFKHSFHGRTLAMITATGQEKYQKGFEPLMPGFSYADFGDVESVRALVTDETCAVMIEPIQGEGGVKMGSVEFFRDLRRLCDEKGLLLIFDEVQVGIGRTGKLFASENFDVQPDIMTLAKALASGLPIGAMIAKEHVVSAFEPGDHASTFGGTPLVTAVALETLKVIVDTKLLENAAAMGDLLLKGLQKLQKKYPMVTGVRGLGLILAIDLDQPARPVVMKAIEKGLLINAVQEKTLRLLPPLIVKRSEIKEGLAILESVFQDMSSSLGFASQPQGVLARP